ncbi:MAG: hypothetical protein JSV00_08285, partial [bacterium]
MKRPIQPRRQLLINRPYQFRFIAEILAAALLATLLSATATYIITKREVGRITAEGRGGPAGLEEVLPGVIVASALVTLASMALLGAYVTLWETHRVVGPVKRMERKLQEMPEGDFRYMES